LQLLGTPRIATNVDGYVASNPLRYYDPYGLDLQELIVDVRDAGLFDTLLGYYYSRDAFKEAKESGLPGPHNGKRDAYRHCVWSCIMASNLTQGDARVIGDNHEEAGSRSGQPSSESSMDKHNNRMGRACA